MSEECDIIKIETHKVRKEVAAVVKILVSNRNYIDELATNQTRNLMVMCERLFLDFEDKDEPVQMAVRIAEKLVDEPELIGKMVQQEAICLLVRLWNMENENFEAEPHAGELQQLHYLGFLSVEEESLMINMEAKDLFFFVLKSRNLKPVMERYTIWERIIFGMLFLYGILDVYACYTIFKKLTQDEVDYGEMEEFLMLRMIFWRAGLLLRNQQDMRLFMASREVMDRNKVFDQWNQSRDLPFKECTKDQYIDLAMGNGVVRWDGIPELFAFIQEEIEDDRYKAMMIIKSIVLMIQNGMSYLDIILQYTKLAEEDSLEEQKELNRLIRRVFDTIPVFGQKGYTREELHRKRGNRFQVIDGGKH